jgi:hypothetical protein
MISITVEGKPKPMSCTVSVGWVNSQDAKGSDLGLTARSVRVLLERAVAEAKRRGRDRVVRYERSMTSVSVIDFRASCPSCHASFTAAVQREKAKTSPLFCPNCGTTTERPEQPELPPATIEIDE